MNTAAIALLVAAISAATSITILLMGPGEPAVVKIPERLRLDIQQEVTKHKGPTELAPEPTPTATLYAPFE